MLRFLDPPADNEDGGKRRREKKNGAHAANARPTLRVVGKQFKPIFAWEKLENIAWELAPLVKRHWEENGAHKNKIPFQPNLVAACLAQAQGLLVCLTVRFEGELIGYHIVVKLPHVHSTSTITWQTDSFWLAPEHRRGWLGYKLLSMVRDELVRQGVKMHDLGVPLNKRVYPLLKRLGYKPVNVHYSQILS